MTRYILTLQCFSPAKYSILCSNMKKYVNIILCIDEIMTLEESKTIYCVTVSTENDVKQHFRVLLVCASLGQVHCPLSTVLLNYA